MIKYADSPKHKGYDLIGNVHGCYSSLCKLLKKLGYVEKMGLWYHNERQAIFMGDAIDKGPEIQQTLELISAMLESGAAQMVMGDHEYDLVQFMLSNKTNDKSENTPRSFDETLAGFSSQPKKLEKHVDWIKQLPIFLHFQNFRVVHACWNSELISKFQREFGGNQINKFLRASSEPDTFLNQFTDCLLRGAKFPIRRKKGLFKNTNVTECNFRVKFWDFEKIKYYNDIVWDPELLPKALKNTLLEKAIIESIPWYDKKQPPLFISHYALSGTPDLISPNIACLDYNAVIPGKLVAYSIDQESGMQPNHFTWVDILSHMSS